MNIIRLNCDVHRSASLFAVYAVSDSQLEDMKTSMVGREINLGEINLGEVAGKHSEVRVVFDADDFKPINQNQGDAEAFRRMFGDYLGNVDPWGVLQDVLRDEAYDVIAKIAPRLDPNPDWWQDCGNGIGYVSCEIEGHEYEAAWQIRNHISSLRDDATLVMNACGTSVNEVFDAMDRLGWTN